MEGCKFGTVSVPQEEVMDAYDEGRCFAIKFRSAYQIRWCRNLGKAGAFCADEFFHCTSLDDRPLGKRGRVEFLNAAEVNKRLGFHLVNESF